MTANPDDLMRVEDLTEIYRVENRTGSLSSVRRDLYQAMAAMQIALRDEYDRLLSKDPDSIMCEGANQRRRKAQRLSGEIVEIRMRKICQMALRGAMGADNTVDQLTAEEKEYYATVLKASRDHKAVLDRLSGNMRYHSPDLSPDEPAPAVSPRPEIKVIPAAPPAVPAKTPVSDENYLEPAVPAAEEPPVPDEEEPEPDEYSEMPDDGLDAPPAEEPAPAAEPAAPEPEDDLLLIRITEDLPTFAGPERDYSLKKEDIVRMPRMMAQVLVNREKAVIVAPTP